MDNVAGVMSAAEVIEMIKRLPPRDRMEVEAFVKSGPSVGSEETPASNYLPQEEAERIAAKIFKENHELFRRLAQ